MHTTHFRDIDFREGHPGGGAGAGAGQCLAGVTVIPCVHIADWGGQAKFADRG